MIAMIAAIAEVFFFRSDRSDHIAWISSDYFESLLLPQLLRGENDSKQSDEFQASDHSDGSDHMETGL